MQIQHHSRLVIIVVILMISIVCVIQSWGIERIGLVENVEEERDAKVKERKSAEEEWLYLPKEKNILSEDTVYTRNANATIRLNDDGSTWELFPHTIARFTTEPTQCPVKKSRRKHVVVTQDRGQITTKVRRGGEVQVGSEAHTTNAVICVAGTTFNTLFSPQSNTTTVTSFEETVMVWNPQSDCIRSDNDRPDSDHCWVKVLPNEQALVVGNMPPIKPKELQDSGVLLSALTTLMLPDALGPPLVLPGVPAHDIYGERRDPRYSLRDATVVIGIDFPE